MKLYAPLFRAPLFCAPLVLLAACGNDRVPAAAPSEQAGADAPLPPLMGSERRILAFGDSLFAGYGLKDGEGYPARLEAALRARGVNARIADAGVSGDTTMDGRERLAFTLDNQTPPPDLVMISLGGNDLLRGVDPALTRANLDAMLTELDRRKVPVLLMGLLAPPNLGAEFRGKYDAIYPQLAKRHNASLVPFFLQSVIARPDMVQRDRVHPTAQGIEAMVAATVDTVAKALPPTAVAPTGVTPPPR